MPIRYSDLWARLTKPGAADEDGARCEHLTRAVLVVVFATSALCVPLFVMLWRAGVFHPRAVIYAAALALLCAAGWWFVARQRWRQARYIPVAVFFVVPLIDTVRYGLSFTNVIEYAAALLLASILFERHVPWIALVAAIASLHLAWVTGPHQAPPQSFAVSVGYIIVVGSLFFIVQTLLMRFYATQLCNALGRSRELAAALERQLEEHERITRASSQSARRYQELYENLRDGWVSVDLDGVFLECNAAYEEMTGYSIAELKQIDFFQLTPDRWHEPEQQIVNNQVFVRGYSDLYEKEYIRKDGVVFPIELQVYLIRDDQGQPVGMWGLVRDITDRKEAEQQLRQSEARYREILEGVQDGYFEVDLAGNFTFVNESMVRLLGYSKDELIGMNNCEYMSKATAAEIYKTFNGIFHSRKPSKGVNWELIRKDGSTFSVETSISLIENAAGEPTGFRGVTRDVTERLWGERVSQVMRSISEAVATSASLQELIANIRDLLGTLIDTTNFYVALYDAQTHGYSFPFYADQHDALRDFDAAPLSGSLTDHVRATGRPLLADAGTKERLRQEGLLGPTMGSNAAIWVGAPLITDKGTIGVVVLQSYEDPMRFSEKDLELLDRAAGHISTAVERKQVEEERRRLEAQLRQAQKLESLGVLAGGVAHDFNNLLQAMAGIPHRMRAHSSDEERIVAAASELDQLIRAGAKQATQLLLFSRKEPLRLQTVDLNQVISDSAGFLRRLIRENITLDLDLCEASLPVRADPGQLEQVLMNLVVNASDAMPNGGRMVIRDGLQDSRVWFEVEDNGVGVQPDLAEKIFEPFFSTKESTEGTGLGLSVVHGIVSQHGGGVEFRSLPDQGTTFRVTLPQAGEISSPAVDDEAQAAPRDAVGLGARILLVEDDEAVRQSLSEVISLLGHQVTAASTGEEAASIAKKQGFDLLLTDYLLPGLSGLELAEMCRARLPDLKVIVLTGYAEDSALRQIVSESRVSLLRKPCGARTLASEIRRALLE